MNLDSIICDKVIKQCFKEMIKNPYEAPRMILIVGPYGTGRKSLARNFVKSNYCTNKSDNASNCGVCETCNNILNNRGVYLEIDYSQITELNDTKYVTITNFEKCPRDIQIHIYNWLCSNKSTVILISENTDNIVDCIMSLSLILRTTLITQTDTVNYLSNINQNLHLGVKEEHLELIAKRSRGHLSDAIKMLNNYKLLDEETFKQSIMSAREYYICFLISCYKNNREAIDKYLSQLKNIPLVYLKIDYESLILEIMKVATKFEKPKDKFMELLIQEIKTKALDLYYIMNDRIIYNSFQNDDTFQAAMYVIYLKLNNKI